MNQTILPKDLENIILDYKYDLEKEEHKKKFKKTLKIIEYMDINRYSINRNKWYELSFSLFTKSYRNEDRYIIYNEETGEYHMCNF